MGACVSTSDQSSWNGGIRGERVSPYCLAKIFDRLKRTKTIFSNHIIHLQELSSIPNRCFTNGKSRTSCLFTQQGQKGINQDAMVVWEDFTSEDVTFCAVFDGHGPNGHLIARKVRDFLPVKLLSFLQSSQSKKDDGTNLNSPMDDLNFLWKEAFLKSYKGMDKELRSHPNLDSFSSGSTAVSVVKQGSNLFTVNIGDSRAILGSKNDLDSPIAIQLTVDLKPDLPSEAERIKRCRGRVFAMEDEPLVPRVWLPFDDTPGLAMARAFGDFCLKEYGVISIPEFSHRLLTDRDQFVVVASDGIWDVLSNEEVVEIVGSAPTRSSAARILVETATREWRLKYPTSNMDDCAVVCLFLDGEMGSESGYDELAFSSATLPSNLNGNAVEFEDSQNKIKPFLRRNYTVRSAEENNTFGRIAVEEENKKVSAEDQNWSGLEGITGANLLVQLPRFSEEKH